MNLSPGRPAVRCCRRDSRRRGHARGGAGGGRRSIDSRRPQGVADLHRLGRAAGRAPSSRRAWVWPPATSRITCARGASKPAGDNGSYLQTVRVLGVKADQPLVGDRHGRRRDAGRSRTAKASRFRRTPAGSGRSPSTASSSPATASMRRATTWTSAGKDVEGAAVVWLGADGPERPSTRSATGGCSPAATATRPSSCRRAGERSARTSAAARGAAAGGAAGAAGAGQTAAAGGRGAHPDAPDFTTVAAARHAGAAERHRQRRLLRVPVQPRAGASTTS